MKTLLELPQTNERPETIIILFLLQSTFSNNDLQAMAEEFTSELSKKGFTVFLAPSFYGNVDSDRFRPYIVRDFLVDSVALLKKRGVLNFLVLSESNDPKQIVTIENAATIIQRKRSFKKFRKIKNPMLISLNACAFNRNSIVEKFRAGFLRKKLIPRFDVANDVNNIASAFNTRRYSWKLFSGFGWHVIHHSFFRAWILSIGIFLLMGAWLWISFSKI